MCVCVCVCVYIYYYFTENLEMGWSLMINNA